jgi:hypothetical protein
MSGDKRCGQFVPSLQKMRGHQVLHLNIFAGGRRIAAIIAIVFALLAGALAWFASPPSYVAVYNVAANGGLWVGTDCSYAEDATETFWAGHVYEVFEVPVRLCFKAERASDGRMLVPFRKDDGTAWLDSPYNSEVMAYTRSYAAKLIMPSADLTHVHELGRKAVQWQFTATALSAFAAAAFILIVSYIMGWVVRGFLGVPRGQDFRGQ